MRSPRTQQGGNIMDVATARRAEIAKYRSRLEREIEENVAELIRSVAPDMNQHARAMIAVKLTAAVSAGIKDIGLKHLSPEQIRLTVSIATLAGLPPV
jgi:hypothetical protein